MLLLLSQPILQYLQCSLKVGQKDHESPHVLLIIVNYRVDGSFKAANVPEQDILVLLVLELKDQN